MFATTDVSEFMYKTNLVPEDFIFWSATVCDKF